jgi:GTP-binding protein
MDSGELEIERGITITSKVTRLDYHATSGQQITINCVDTPGHADFCGEVDRILSMVDGVALVVDAAEGPMTQTKYVLSRALALGLKPIVVLNKCDRADAATKIESGETESKVQSLFDALGANEEQMDFVTVYASAREGWVTTDPFEALEWGEASGGTNEPNMSDLLDCILEHIPEPFVRSYVDIENPEEAKEGTAFADDKFSLAAVTVGYDQYLGRTCTGRIFSGSVSITDEVTFIKRDKEAPQGSVMPGTVAGIFVFEGISRTPYEGTAYAGDIVTLAGVPDSIAVGDTLTGRKNPVDQPIETPPLVPPTLSMEFGSNNGPLAGLEGTNIASSKIRDRLFAETDNNVTLTIEKSAADSEKTTVFARGELQLGILVEQMRREGFEIIISPPRILTKICPDTGKELEPFEEVTVDVDSEYSGAVVSALTGDRKGVLLEMSESSGDGKSRLVFEAPSRSLLGFNSEIATATKGSAVVTHIYIEDREHAGNLGTGLAKGKLVSNDNGKASAYALSSIAARGELFIEPGDAVYNGMVIGENAKMGDMEVNPIRAKEKTNMRTQAKDETIRLPPPKRRNVEELIGYMSSDEIIEVTPKSVRLRKEILDSSARERAARSKNKAMKALKGK